MNKPLIDQLVDRFLACPLPETVKVDPCAMPEKVPYLFERTGTNLLNATETTQILQYVARPLLNRVAELEAENVILRHRLAGYSTAPTEPNFAVGDPSIPMDLW